MDSDELQRRLLCAKKMGRYGTGYTKGLRRHYHGPTFINNMAHERLLNLGIDGDAARMEEGDGYRDGIEGKDIPLDRLEANAGGG